MLDDVLVSLASILCWVMYLLVWQVYYLGDVLVSLASVLCWAVLSDVTNMFSLPISYYCPVLMLV